MYVRITTQPFWGVINHVINRSNLNPLQHASFACFMFSPEGFSTKKMKPKKMKLLRTCLLLLPLCVAMLGAGCEKEDELFWEISPSNESAVIQEEVDGIEFKFCLLDEEGKPATVFDEGDNFSFYFSVTNNSSESLFFCPDYAFSEENDFCRTYTSSLIDEGKPYVFNGVDLIGIGAYSFNSGEAYAFEQSWMDDRDYEWRWSHGYFKSTKQELLTDGNYYTGFKYRFEFVRLNDGPTLYTDTLSFKINFKIQ